MSNRFVRLAVTVASAILVGVVLLAVGLSANVAFSVTFGLIIWGALSMRDPSPSQVLTAPTSVEGETSSTDIVTTFTNVAFSSEEPTWKGWRRDVGVVTVTSQAITMDAKKKTLTIAAPFVAELHDHKFLHWTMIRVTRSDGAMPPATAYLVVRGAPRTKDSVEPEVVTEESLNLVTAINTYN